VKPNTVSLSARVPVKALARWARFFQSRGLIVRSRSDLVALALQEGLPGETLNYTTSSCLPALKELFGTHTATWKKIEEAAWLETEEEMQVMEEEASKAVEEYFKKGEVDGS